MLQHFPMKGDGFWSLSLFQHFTFQENVSLGKKVTFASVAIRRWHLGHSKEKISEGFLAYHLSSWE